MKLGDVKDVAIVGAVLGGLYLLTRAGSKAAEALTSAGEAIGSGLYDFFHPNQVGETTFYVVTFPDGSRHSVPASAVDSSGVFLNKNLSPTYAGDGKRYRIVVSKIDGTRSAFPV